MVTGGKRAPAEGKALDREGESENLDSRALLVLFGTDPPVTVESIARSLPYIPESGALVDIIRRFGLPGSVVGALVQAVGPRCPQELLADALDIPLDTFRYMLVKPHGLAPNEGVRALHLAEIITKAEDVFGSRERVQEWLAKPALGLEGRRPLELIASDAGYEVVRDFLTRLDYGVYT